jgi:glycoside/pentoside/hexuronide:cation symporter, GPH family
MANSEGKTLGKSYSVTDESSKKLPVLEKIGYGVGDAASNLYFQTFMMWITIYYTDVFGISAAAMGWMFLATRIWDAVNDPIMGMIADRTESRWGKFRPYIIGMAPFLAICGMITFFTPDFGSGAKLLYAYITYTLLTMLYTAVNVPYSALMGVMTPNSLERTGASQYRFVLAFGGQLIVSGATLPLVAYLGRGNIQMGWTWTMGVFGVIALVLFSFTFFSTKERVHPPKGQKVDTKQDLKNLFSNAPWVLVAIATVFQLLYAVMRGSSTPYFFKYYVLDQHLQIFTYNMDLSIDKFTSYFAAVGSISTLLGAVMSKVFARGLGKKNAYTGFLILSAVISCGYYYLEPSSVILIFVLNICLSFCMGSVSVLQWAIYTDTADYGEWKFGRRSTGLIMAASLFALKLGLAFGGTFVGWILEYHGFVANTAQSDETMYGIKMLMSFYPAIFGVIGGLVMIFYPLKNTVMVKIEEDLLKRRAEA